MDWRCAVKFLAGENSASVIFFWLHQVFMQSAQLLLPPVTPRLADTPANQLTGESSSWHRQFLLALLLVFALRLVAASPRWHKAPACWSPEDDDAIASGWSTTGRERDDLWKGGIHWFNIKHNLSNVCAHTPNMKPNMKGETWVQSFGLFFVVDFSRFLFDSHSLVVKSTSVLFVCFHVTQMYECVCVFHYCLIQLFWTTLVLFFWPKFKSRLN